MRITCDTKDTLPLSALTEFQGGLKKRTADDTKKIEKSINDYGFATPFFVWKHDGINSVLDGHGRLQTLKEMQKRGEEIPALPVVYIDCPNEAAAKNLLLRICSTYGEMTVESVLEFVGDTDIELEDLQLPDTMLKFSTDTFEGEDTADETNLGDVNFKYQNQYGVIVMCNSEREQESVYNRLSGEGYTCKVVTV